MYASYVARRSATRPCTHLMLHVAPVPPLHTRRSTTRPTARRPTVRTLHVAATPQTLPTRMVFVCRPHEAVHEARQLRAPLPSPYRTRYRPRTDNVALDRSPPALGLHPPTIGAPSPCSHRRPTLHHWPSVRHSPRRPPAYGAAQPIRHGVAASLRADGDRRLAGARCVGATGHPIEAVGGVPTPRHLECLRVGAALVACRTHPRRAVAALSAHRPAAALLARRPAWAAAARRQLQHPVRAWAAGRHSWAPQGGLWATPGWAAAGRQAARVHRHTRRWLALAAAMAHQAAPAHRRTRRRRASSVATAAGPEGNARRSHWGAAQPSPLVAWAQPPCPQGGQPQPGWARRVRN